LLVNESIPVGPVKFGVSDIVENTPLIMVALEAEVLDDALPVVPALIVPLVPAR
jgi:hypothetical protein